MRRKASEKNIEKNRMRKSTKIIVTIISLGFLVYSLVALLSNLLISSNMNNKQEIYSYGNKFNYNYNVNLIPNNFKIIRYYGFYRRKVAIHDKMLPIIKAHARKFKTDLTKFRNSISISFNRDPYDCPKCGTRLLYSVFLN